MALPNVKVRFIPALISGFFFAGIAFQTFQMLYIGGMLWISRYNAIYGEFAAFPLLLLWVLDLDYYALLCQTLLYNSKLRVSKGGGEERHGTHPKHPYRGVAIYIAVANALLPCSIVVAYYRGYPIEHVVGIHK